MQSALNWKKLATAPDTWWLIGLTGAALLLLGLNLGQVPLKDWDEGLVAQVAKEIWQNPANTWLHPTLWGEPYLNKPPLVHWLIAGLYAVGGVNEWTARLPSAALTLISVPLLYSLSRELFHHHLPAIFATAVYVTSLPVIRNGRFAMLDGAILCFLVLLIWCLLRSRRNYRYLLGMGWALGLLCLTKGVLVALLLGGIALLFLIWDTPRLLKQPYFWLGLGLGCLPAIAWYAAQWMHYGAAFWSQNLVEQSLQRIWTDVEDNGAPPWYYLLELLKYGLPWILFLPAGCKLAWDNRNLSWAKLALVWAGLYFVAISLMTTKLPWYSLPLFPALALLIGAQMAELWQQSRQEGIPQFLAAGSRVWPGLLGLLAVGGCGGAIYFWVWAPAAEADVGLILATAGLTLAIAALLAARQNPQFLSLLVWGTFLALGLLLASPHWAWELAESYPVQPVATLLQSEVPGREPVYTSYPYHRPSLNFYSQRRVVPASQKQLRQVWRQQRAALLVDQGTFAALKLKAARTQPVPMGDSLPWLLVTNDKI
jgi:4-amino-4-deoxy-L-arabinose transferase-like glycosyltransferase